MPFHHVNTATVAANQNDKQKKIIQLKLYFGINHLISNVESHSHFAYIMIIMMIRSSKMWFRDGRTSWIYS